MAGHLIANYEMLLVELVEFIKEQRCYTNQDILDEIDRLRVYYEVSQEGGEFMENNKEYLKRQRNKAVRVLTTYEQEYRKMRALEISAEESKANNEILSNVLTTLGDIDTTLNRG